MRRLPNPMMEATYSTEQHRTEAPASPADGLDSFLRIARVMAITDSSKATIWRWIKAGRFPRPVVMEGNTVLWSLAQVRTWQQDKLSQQRQEAAP